MAINFEEIPDDIEVARKPDGPYIRTVLEEINARQNLLAERSIKCENIGALYEKPKKRPLRYTYKYFCVCPTYCPQYACKHIGNIVIDRDVLTSQEHIVHLATPKEDKGAVRKLPRFYQKKFIIPNCTARVNKLASPNPRRVVYAMTHFRHVLNKRHTAALNRLLEKQPKVERTSITLALDWMEEEKRLRKVAKRVEKARCKKLEGKIINKKRTQIKKIICVLFEEMKDFLLNDQFIMDESSTLVAVILETLREFTDKEFYTTSNIREYQKILAFNLAVWINKFISNLNIHVSESPDQPQQQPPAETDQQLLSFLPVEDYISSGGSEGYIETLSEGKSIKDTICSEGAPTEALYEENTLEEPFTEYTHEN